MKMTLEKTGQGPLTPQDLEDFASQIKDSGGHKAAITVQTTNDQREGRWWRMTAVWSA